MIFNIDAHYLVKFDRIPTTCSLCWLEFRDVPACISRVGIKGVHHYIQLLKLENVDIRGCYMLIVLVHLNNPIALTDQTL